MHRLAPVVIGVLLTLACNRRTELDHEQGVAPPPPPSAAPGACKDGGGKPGDPVSAAFFPREITGYCIDPNGETRAYGKESNNPIDQVCLEQFDGECEVYKGYGLDRVVTLRYVDGKGSTGEVSVTLARFDTKDGSYGFFTRRVVAGQDPAESKIKPLDAGGQGALGTGIAYVWRGLYVGQLAYTSTEETPQELAATSAKVLPPMAKALGERLSGEKDPPRAVTLLPTDERIPLGVDHQFGAVLGVEGVGTGALGHYRSGGKRWQALVVVRPDADSAEDILKTFRKLDGAKKLKGLPIEAVSFALKPDEASPPVRWVVSQRGDRVVGIGDDPYAFTPDTSTEGLAKVTLSEREKLARLQRLLKTSSQNPTDAKPASAASAAP